MKSLKRSCQKHKIGGLSVIKVQINYMKICSFLHAQFTETIKVVENLLKKSLWWKHHYTPANKVYAIYSTPFGCYGKLIRSDHRGPALFLVDLGHILVEKKYFFSNKCFFRPICVPNQPKNALGPYESDQFIYLFLRSNDWKTCWRFTFELPLGDISNVYQHCMLLKIRKTTLKFTLINKHANCLFLIKTSEAATQN